MKTSYLKLCYLLLLPLQLQVSIANAQDVSLYRVFETSVTNTTAYGNKFKDVTLNVTYTHASSSKTLNFWGFYDGNGNGAAGNIWKMRFMPDALGTWDYTYTWSDGTSGGSGSFNCVDSGAGKGIIKAYQENTNWFAYNGIDPVWLKSYYIIEGGIMLDDANWMAENVYQKVLDKGYNHLQLNSLPLAYTYQHFSDGPNNGDGFMYTGSNPSSSMNLAICKSVDEHLGWLNSKDIGVHFFQGFDGKEEYAKNSPQYAEMSSEERDFLVKYICARLAPYANISGWCYTWETYNTENERDLMDRLAQYDPWGHLKTYMQGLYPGDAGNAGWWDYEGYSFVSTEYVGSGSSPEPTNRNGSQQQPGYVNAKMKELADYYDKPIFHSECWGMWRSCYGASQTSIRKTAWANALAATTATWNDLESCDGGNSSSDIFAWTEAATAVDLLADVMQNDVVFHNMNPNNSIVNNGAFALAEAGKQYLVFKENGGSFNLNLNSATYSGDWIDTKNGNRNAVSSFSHGGGNKSFSAPSTSTDWVLLLTSGTNTTPLSACFTSSATSGLAPLSVSFDASCSQPSTSNNITSYSWNFGDGSTGSSSTPSHTFTAVGTYTVTLTVTDASGTDTESTTISVTPESGDGTGLKGEYHSGINFGVVLLTRTDANIDFDWGNGSPDSSVPNNNYTVRWTGEVVPLFTETYTFETESDDGARLWVNGVQLVNQWVDQGPTKVSGTIALTAGQKYSIEMEYYENGGGAVAKLRWSSNSQAYEIIPQSQLFPATTTIVPVTSVSISNCPSTALTIGGNLDLNETVSPSNATNKSVTWSSSNTSVATVNASGLVTALTEGSTTILATSVADNNQFAECAINVEEAITPILPLTYGNGGTPGTGNPWVISGTTRLEAENYNQGGQGTGYNDTNVTNSGGQYRSEGVDIENCSEGGVNVGWIQTNEWLEFTIDVATAGDYTLALRVARSPSGNSSVKVLAGANSTNLSDLTGTMTVPNTGGWQNWQTISETVSLSGGEQILRIFMVGGNFNINYLELSSSVITPQPPVITSALTASANVGQAFSYTIAATNSPTSYSATGLPADVSVNTNTGAISGTPATAGTSNISISATNANGTDTETLVITVTAAGTCSWTFAAAEDGNVSFTGTKEVRYGANGTYVTQTFTNGTPCTNAVFGDPLPGVQKSCEICESGARLSQDINTELTENGAYIKVYPMPVTHKQLTFKLGGLTEPTAQIELIDMLGKSVKSIYIKADKGEGTITIDVAELSNGLYFAKTKIDGRVLTQKVLIGK